MHSHFFPIVQSHTNIPRNQEIRMKTKIVPYPQNQVEFIQQSGNKLHDFRCVVYIYEPL